MALAEKVKKTKIQSLKPTLRVVRGGDNSPLSKPILPLVPLRQREFCLQLGKYLFSQSLIILFSTTLFKGGYVRGSNSWQVMALISFIAAEFYAYRQILGSRFFERRLVDIYPSLLQEKDPSTTKRNSSHNQQKNKLSNWMACYWFSPLTIVSFISFLAFKKSKAHSQPPLLFNYPKMTGVFLILVALSPLFLLPTKLTSTNNIVNYAHWIGSASTDYIASLSDEVIFLKTIKEKAKNLDHPIEPNQTSPLTAENKFNPNLLSLFEQNPPTHNSTSGMILMTAMIVMNRMEEKRLNVHDTASNVKISMELIEDLVKVVELYNNIPPIFAEFNPLLFLFPISSIEVFLNSIAVVLTQVQFQKTFCPRILEIVEKAEKYTRTEIRSASDETEQLNKLLEFRNRLEKTQAFRGYP